METQTLYSQVKQIVSSLELNEVVTIDMPSSIGLFRKYLVEIALKANKQFITKVSEGKLKVKRIEKIGF